MTLKYLYFIPFLKLSIILYCLFYSLNINAQTELSPQHYIKNDVDSIGDLWIFTLDKTGSMLFEKTVTGGKISWTPEKIKDDVINKLSKNNGILDQINYIHDRIIIMETGYGKQESDSYGREFSHAPSLDKSFIHIVSALNKFNTNKKNGLTMVLSDLLEKQNYIYRESFVSQIRVLSLHRLTEYIKQNNASLTFRKIHIVTITDDADVNDQWKMDYYTLKRDANKIEQLNTLHNKYIYSSFTQKGGGFLEERVEFTDISSKNHIYMYDYITRQQRTQKIKYSRDSLIQIAPLDGELINMKIKQKHLFSENINFIYIDSLVIGTNIYHINQYINDKLKINFPYEIDNIKNIISVFGKVQVQYNDSIYGEHYKCYPFEQHTNEYTATADHFLNILMYILIISILSGMFYILWLRPNSKLFTIYTYKNKVRILRGFNREWEKLIPLAYSNMDEIVFSKHDCFKQNKYDFFSSKIILIDSPVPLIFTENVWSDSTKNNLCINANNSYGKYPNIVIEKYKTTLAWKIAILQSSNNKYIRKKIYPWLNKIIFFFSPHYYYWNSHINGIISTPLLPGHHFLFEHNNICEKHSFDDEWLNTYYQGDFPTADVLICSNKTEEHVMWDIYQLCGRKLSGYGISYVKHLIHFKQNLTNQTEIKTIKSYLKRVIQNEMMLNNIIFIDEIKYNSVGVHFNVTNASCMSFICLVENTVEEKCQILYSPLKDFDSLEKNIVIMPSAVSRVIWTSLIPFDCKKNRPVGNITRCDSLDIIKEGNSGQKTLFLKKNYIEFENIKILKY